MAGVIPELVKGVLLEDPPFFNARPGEFENTFVYWDGFKVTHDFLNQTEEKEYLVYNIEHGYNYNYLGNRYFGKDWVHKLAEEVKEKLKDAPGEIPKMKGMSENPYRGAYEAVYSSVSKLVAAGADYRQAYLTERTGRNLYRNVPGKYDMILFQSAVEYYREKNKK